MGVQVKYLDMMAAHSRELVRDLISIVLLLGTSTGTIWTFSNGTLTLNGALERIVSVGGIAAGLEIGAIFTGFYIQMIDSRIRTAKRREQQQEYRHFRRNLYLWFAAILAISFIANLYFRTQQLHSASLGVLTSGAPLILICLFTIVLRPVPQDYAELGRQATQQGLLELTRTSSKVLVRHMRAIGRGQSPTPEQMQQLTFAVSMLRTYAATSEQQALEYAVDRSAGVDVVESTAVELLSSKDIERDYGIPRRTAQLWVSETPGRKRASKGNSWLAPAGAIYSRHGLPKRPENDYSARSGQQEPANRTQNGAADMQVAVVEA